KLDGYVRPLLELSRKRVEAGMNPLFQSHMWDGSAETLADNLESAQELLAAAAAAKIIPEGEITPAGRQEAAREAGAVVVHAGEGAEVDPARVPGLLAGHGHTRLLTEGGPRLLGRFAAAGVLDELCLTVSPRITAGNAARILDGPGFETPVEYELASLLEEDGFLFSRYRRPREAVRK
ncbi:dihydrofolate reductase family protein, partial [Streptomyces atacamensis]|uniref:dihydrofolate reductase family protein n=1 Tax=Streptomyces atacamensis TaxID=531966 RepID=UPI00399C9E9C